MGPHIFTGDQGHPHFVWDIKDPIFLQVDQGHPHFVRVNRGTHISPGGSRIPTFVREIKDPTFCREIKDPTFCQGDQGPPHFVKVIRDTDVCQGDQGPHIL